MNIYTIKIKKKHLVAAIIAAGVLLATLILLLPGEKSMETGAAITIREQEDCSKYLAQLGYETDPSASEMKKVLVPKEFDAVYEAYNQMQKECGFDLTRYAGKKVDLTTCRITNWPNEEIVLADVLVYKEKVIGGAVYTAAVDGFMYGLQPMSSIPKS